MYILEDDDRYIFQNFMLETNLQPYIRVDFVSLNLSQISCKDLPFY